MTEQELNEFAEKYEISFEILSDGSIIFNDDTSLIVWNSQTRVLTSQAAQRFEIIDADTPPLEAVLLAMCDVDTFLGYGEYQYDPDKHR